MADTLCPRAHFPISQYPKRGQFLPPTRSAPRAPRARCAQTSERTADAEGEMKDTNGKEASKEPRSIRVRTKMKDTNGKEASQKPRSIRVRTSSGDAKFFADFRELSKYFAQVILNPLKE